MIKFRYSYEKTNSFRPIPWHWSIDPFNAYRGKGARYSTFLAVSKEYKPNIEDMDFMSESYTSKREYLDKNYSKIIKTKKGTTLLVPCNENEDEKILLLTLRGGFRGHFSRIEAVNAEVLLQRGGNIHCCPTEHLVVRLNNDGYVFSETGRRCGTGLVEIYSWQDYISMPTEEFEVWRESWSA